MNKTIIRLTSVTYAIRAQKLLEQQGIRANVKKILQGRMPGGCGYGVDVPTSALAAAQQALASAGIRVVELMRE